MRPNSLQQLRGLILLGLALSACAAPPSPAPTAALTATAPPTQIVAPAVGVTPLPTRTRFGPGEKLPYVTQSGDYVDALAQHFNTTPEEILAANPALPPSSTLPSGLALQIPAYYFPLGGSPFKIIPDSEFVYGPAQKDFDLRTYLQSQPGFLKTLSAYVNQKQRDAAGTIDYVARQYSLNPKLLLALMEWRSGALTNADASADAQAAPFGPLPEAGANKDWYLQMIWVAEQLNVAYYGWRTGALTALTLPGSYRVRVDAYQNAGTVGVQGLIAQIVPRTEFAQAAGPDGFARTYRQLWGDVWRDPPDVIPGGLTQPKLTLPFQSGRVWTLTGGPHAAWGQLGPWGALDFAPAGVSKCGASAEFAIAVAPGLVARSSDSTVILDLDGDGYEGTGWVVFYFHVAANDMIAAGTRVKLGDPIGHPSCEGGVATGTHTHLARRFNGEWLPADGIVPFDLGGWVATRGSSAYQGRLVRLGAWVEASTTSTAQNRVYWVP